MTAPPSLGEPNQALNEAVRAPTVNVAQSPARVIFQSFYPDSIELLQQLAPDTPRVLLVSQEIEAEDSWRSLVEQAAAAADGIGPVGFLGWPWNVGPAHRAGLIVHVYTLNASWEMRLLSFFGVDGIFTDRSDLAIKVLGRGGPVDVEAVFDRISY